MKTAKSHLVAAVQSAPIAASLAAIHSAMQSMESAQTKLAKIVNSQMTLLLQHGTSSKVADLIAGVCTTYYLTRETAIRATKLTGNELACALKPARNVCSYISTLCAASTGYALVKERGGDYVAIKYTPKADKTETAKGKGGAARGASVTSGEILDSAPSADAAAAAQFLGQLSLPQLLRAVAGRYNSKEDFLKAADKLSAKIWAGKPNVRKFADDGKRVGKSAGKAPATGRAAREAAMVAEQGQAAAQARTGVLVGEAVGSVGVALTAAMRKQSNGSAAAH